jgi:hypothetical protein
MRARSLPAAVLGAAIAAIAIAAPAARVDAAPRAACTTTSGVTVIVDFTYFHGSIERGCAAGAPNTALAAIRDAGFGTAGTTRYGDAFVCRIDNEPAPNAEACNDTPPANSSWSFYYAHASDTTWTYSTSGVLSYRPPPGTALAFAYGSYAKPGVGPAAVLPKRLPTTAPPATPPPTDPPVVAPANATTVTTGAATTTAPPATAPRAVPLHPNPSTSATTSTTSSPRVVDRNAAIGDEQVSPSSGSPVGAVLAVALVLGLGVAAGFAIRARRGRRAT